MKRFLLLVLALAFSTIAEAEITLPHIFSNDMVLQRETAVLLYGWAGPNEEFSIYTSWNDTTVNVKTGNDAKWQIQVDTPNAGGPFIIKFKGEENEIILDNVLIGEVWLCSGQSNMEWSANSGIDNKEAEIANADYPNIRLFTVQKRTSDYPQEDVSGTWQVCSSETMPDFSAVAYFFARKIQKELGIPIGLIDSSWGASCAEVWTPENVFEQHPELVEAHELVKPNPWVTVERSTLYNAMINPLTKFKIGGVLWYQGESNTVNAESYQDLFTEMITSWRNKWQINFPFYYVQIAPYTYGREFEGGVLRDQQRRTLQLENTGMAMTSDICTVEDIHPQNKQDVGLRLANIALKQHFKTLDTEVYGPLFKSSKVNGKEMEVAFSNSNGLKFKGKKPEGFEISNEKGEWFPANAKIKNDKVVVSCTDVKNPVAVRYAWKSTVIGNVFNGVGLPASTFTSE
ncbi:sialate O-acetylesterase [Maribacter sp. X9]|uniref:sialate O-acetylesterase n=1 Tax=Maribacter sp. X9 TaxID=3402159 RepID=UPI003AF3DC2D